MAKHQGLAHTVITSLAMAPDGSIWAGGARGGVSRLPPDFPDRPLRTFSTPHGLTGEAILSVAVDREGNTWLGSDGSGAMKIARHGFTTYTEADGLANARIDSLFEDRAGALYASAIRNNMRAINRFDGERFTAIYPNLKQQHGKLGWGWAQIILQDRAGEWWVSTGEGLARFPRMPAEKLSRALPAAVYSPPEANQASASLRIRGAPSGVPCMATATGSAARKEGPLPYLFSTGWARPSRWLRRSLRTTAAMSGWASTVDMLPAITVMGGFTTFFRQRRCARRADLGPLCGSRGPFVDRRK